MRNHTTPMFWELSGAQGKSVTFVPGGSATTSVKFQLTNMPTGKQGKFWYYLMSMIVAVTMQIDNDIAESADIPSQALFRFLRSAQVYTPILGTLYQHSNTRGTILGNVIQYLGMGYSGVGRPQEVGLANEARTMYFRVPFACEFLRKPHEFSPWGGFLEGGNVELIFEPTSIFAGVSGQATTVTSATVRAWCEFQPSPEAVIHTPMNFREHQNIAAGVRITIPDIGSPDGLQGIDQSRGAGIMSLYDLMAFVGSADVLDLQGNTSPANITSFDIPWRDQIRLDSVDATFMALQAMMGNPKKFNPSGAVQVDLTGFPYSDVASSTQLNLAQINQTMVFPFIGCGRDLETSKLQTVAGAKDINISYAAPVATAPRLIGHYTYVYDEAFVKTVLVPRIAPGQADTAELTTKTLNKQTGGTYGIGKLAYVRQKIQGANG